MSAAAEPRVELVEVEKGRVVRLQLQAPPDNALDLILLRSLQAAVEALAGWPDLVCVILDGGAKDFSAGLAPDHLRPPFVSVLLPSWHAVVRSLASLDAVLVAQVRGRCLGAGADLTLLCDAVYADSTTRLAFNDVALGGFSPLASLLLPGRIGQLRATQWLLAAQQSPPEEALAAGLVTASASGWDSLETLVTRFLDRQILPHSNVALRAQTRATRMRLRTLLTDDLVELEQLYLQRIVREVE